MLTKRIDYFTYVFELLQATNSRLEKEQIVKDIPPEYKEDWDFIIECLAGKHKFGYTYKKVPYILNINILNATVKQTLQFLLTPMQEGDLSQTNINAYIGYTTAWYDFFAPIVNRTLRLGIGNSLIDRAPTAPMLAKKFEGFIKPDKAGYFITEKLDGNRCIASWNGTRWVFTSRNGKEMHVDFDMSGMNKKYIYDGEVLSPEQTAHSQQLWKGIVENGVIAKQDELFNVTSGLINQHTKDKKLIYNIFDIVADEYYYDRRYELSCQKFGGENIRIVPVLAHYKTTDEINDVWGLLNKVTDTGAEGLMINCGSAKYINKRTDQLLKLKKVYTMDMKVIRVEFGSGKYENMIGALVCEATTTDGKHITCKVGTGLSDEQRQKWAEACNYIDDIIDKIVEVSYFSLSQDADKRGTNEYSLRFPRLKSVRGDKNTTSEF